MGLIDLKIDLNEVKAIREALQELVVLLRAKLLADGYLQQPPVRSVTTIEDVHVVDANSAWQQIEILKRAKRREEQQLEKELWLE